MPAPPPREVWFLEGYPEEGKPMVRVRVSRFPFVIGRQLDSDLVLAHQGVSGSHAELRLDGEGLSVLDLGSRNGTYVNRVRTEGAQVLQAGDILHFARSEFRLVRATQEDLFSATMFSELDEVGLPAHFPLQAQAFEELLRQRAVVAVYQPLVALDEARGIVAYEALGRGCQPGAPRGAGPLFALAAALESEVRLSRVMREEAVIGAVGLPADRPLFLNTHPAEVDHTALITSLSRLRAIYPDRKLVVEVHEKVVTRPEAMRGLASMLAELDVDLAYDDFGAGQARLVELAEAPPHYLKFDRSLIKGIDAAAAGRQQLVAALVRMARELGAVTLAEGIETEGETETCRQLGFELAQGFHLGRPVPPEDLAE